MTGIFMKIRNHLWVLCFLLIFFAGTFGLKAQEADSVQNLPLELSGSKGTLDVLVVYLTGDGGWNNFNQRMFQEFEKQGYGVVALNSRKYFWDAKSPEGFAQDIENLSNYYLKAWKKSSVMIVGYSFGADVGSFLPGRVSPELLKKIVRIALISPSSSTDFVIRLSDLIGQDDNDGRKFKVKPEIEKSDLPTVCTFGNEEVKELKGSLQNSKSLTIVELPGDHQYRLDFELLLKTIGI